MEHTVGSAHVKVAKKHGLPKKPRIKQCRQKKTWNYKNLGKTFNFEKKVT